MSRIPAEILKLLKDAREAAALENARFDWDDSHMTAKCRSGDFEGRPDKFIKERVRIHHSTWIIAKLDRAIEWAERTPVSRPLCATTENVEENKS